MANSKYSGLAKVYASLVKQGKRKISEIEPEELRDEVQTILEEEGWVGPV